MPSPPCGCLALDGSTPFLVPIEPLLKDIVLLQERRLALTELKIKLQSQDQLTWPALCTSLMKCWTKLNDQRVETDGILVLYVVVLLVWLVWRVIKREINK
jgi:hypothetical protein